MPVYLLLNIREFLFGIEEILPQSLHLGAELLELFRQLLVPLHLVLGEELQLLYRERKKVSKEDTTDLTSLRVEGRVPGYLRPPACPLYKAYTGRGV